MDLKSVSEYIQEKIGDILSPNTASVIGIDIGMSAIKFADISKLSDGNYKINRFVVKDLPDGTVIEDEIQKEDELLQALQQGLKELNSNSKFVCLGLSGPNTLIKRLQLAGGMAEEVEDQVIWETEQYLPFPVDEGNISFSIVGENPGGGLDVIVGAVRKNVLKTFKELVERANVRVKIVDLNAAAVFNMFEYLLGEGAMVKGKSWIMMDLGAQKTHFMICKNGIMVFFKEINIGGLTITEEIQRQMGVSYLEAESLKIHGDGKGNIPEEIVDLINQVLDTFFAELKKTVDFWTSSTSEEEFDGCVITGGCSQINGLAEALQELFETEVQVINPMDKMTYNQNNIDEETLGDLSSRGLCALGLAMRVYQKND